MNARDDGGASLLPRKQKCASRDAPNRGCTPALEANRLNQSQIGNRGSQMELDVAISAWVSNRCSPTPLIQLGTL
jgi:hypothetical protein